MPAKVTMVRSTSFSLNGGSRQTPLPAVVAVLMMCGCATDPEATHEESAITACEEAISESARSPSSYRRVWGNAGLSETTSFEEYRRQREDELRRLHGSTSISDRAVAAYAEELKNNGQYESDLRRGWDNYRSSDLRGRQRATVILEYDSDNQFGANLRGFALCSLRPGGADGFTRSDVTNAGAIPKEDGEATKRMLELQKQ